MGSDGGTSGDGKAKQMLWIIPGSLLALLVGYTLYTGQTIAEIGLGSLGSVKFAKPGNTPPPAVGEGRGHDADCSSGCRQTGRSGRDGAAASRSRSEIASYGGGAQAVGGASGAKSAGGRGEREQCSHSTPHEHCRNVAWAQNRGVMGHSANRQCRGRSRI